MTRHARHGSAGLELLLDDEVLEDTRLSRVLSAARAPAQAEELAGLVAARTAFASTFTAPLATRVPANRPKALAGRLIALKAIAAVSGATLVGGVAFAASHSNLLRSPAHHQHNQQAPQGPQPGAPQGSWVASTAVSPGHGAVTHGKAGGKAAQPRGNSTASGRAHQSNAPHPHPTNTPPSTSPGQGRTHHPKNNQTQQPSDGRTAHPSQPPRAGSAAHAVARKIQ